jgi:hypothetical protein
VRPPIAEAAASGNGAVCPDGWLRDSPKAKGQGFESLRARMCRGCGGPEDLRLYIQAATVE